MWIYHAVSSGFLQLVGLNVVFIGFPQTCEYQISGNTAAHLDVLCVYLLLKLLDPSDMQLL